jgi:hypothetical protein
VDVRPAGLELHIEELVVEGLGDVDGRRLAAVVRQELVRLVSERGVPPSWLAGGSLDRLDAGDLTLRSGMPVEVMAGKIARAVHGGLPGSGGR